MSDLEYISFIAPWFAQPIADLFERIFDYDCTPNEIQANPFEAAFSCSIILLSLTMLEGIAARAESMKERSKSNSRFKAVEYLENKCKNHFNKNELREIFAVRDAIAHGHLWRTKVSTDIEDWMKILERELSSGFGDNKLKEVLDENVYRTKALQIELVPSKMIRQDAIKVFNIVAKAINHIDAQTDHIMGIDACRISFRGNDMNLFGFSDALKHVVQQTISADAKNRRG